MALSPIKTFLEGEILTATDLNAEFLNIRSSEVYEATFVDDASVIATGSVTGRSLADRFAERFNVKDYGAMGDNFSDDTAEIQAAIDAVPTGGGVVYMPRGTYRITAPLVITVSNTYLIGDGASATDILMRTNSVNGIVVGNGSTTVQNVILQDFRIRPNGFTASAGSAIRFHAPGVSTVGIYRVEIRDQFVGVQTSANIQIFEDLTITATVDSGIGIRFDGSSEERNTLIRHCFINGAQQGIGAGPQAGIQIEAPAAAIRIEESDVLHHGVGLYLVGGSGIIGAIWADNCFFDQNSDDNIRIDGNGIIVNRIRLSNCWISGLGTIDTNRGILLQAGTGSILGVTVIGCTIILNGLSGINITDAEEVSIIGCAIAKNSMNSSGVSHGIAIAANVDDFMVSNCRIGKFGSVNGQQGRPIVIAAGTSNKYIIQGNDCNGNGTSDQIVDGGTGTEKQIYGNIPIQAVDTLKLGGELGIDDGMTAPATLAGTAKLFVDSADGVMKWKAGDGAVTPLGRPIALRAVEAAALITITDADSSLIVSGTIVNVLNITGASNPGQRLVLMWADGATFNITSGAGNDGQIHLSGGSDITAADSFDTLDLMSDGDAWYEIGRSANTGV